MASRQGRRQAAYELTIGDEFFHVDSADSVLVPWPARPLASREAREVRVRVIGTDGEVSDWSDPVSVERGLVAPDWTATLIEPARDERGPAALLRRSFVADGEITRARLYITAHGLYVAELNGERVGDDALAPGWTSYHHRLRYQTYDVTGQVRAGENAIGVQVADGWWRGRVGFVPGWRDTYGSSLGLLAQLEIDYADGRRQVIPTDEGWHSSTGPIRSADLYWQVSMSTASGGSRLRDAARRRPATCAGCGSWAHLTEWTPPETVTPGCSAPTRSPGRCTATP
ncbi:alpha-L-rhamnosidase N-terminal domain-containing protein [Streptomyces sp. NPDC002688]|uniref:alpha-L-rhamnosidase N-terminal domain-containing protein n=1 Tax=Streptomyces sp. NPDC002688 TaxID=3154423 RepID=UPI0033186C7C